MAMIVGMTMATAKATATSMTMQITQMTSTKLSLDGRST